MDTHTHPTLNYKTIGHSLKSPVHIGMIYPLITPKFQILDCTGVEGKKQKAPFIDKLIIKSDQM